jgi:hypothetical protein
MRDITGVRIVPTGSVPLWFFNCDDFSPYMEDTPRFGMRGGV